MPSQAFNSVDHWRRRTHQLREGLLRRVEDLAAFDYPEESAHQIIQFLVAFFEELAVPIDKAASEQELRFISHLIQSHGVFLQWLDNAHTAQTPRALAQLLKMLMDGISPQSRVVVVPQADYNYGIRDLGVHLNKLVEDWIPKSRQARIQQYVAAPLKLIAFPRIERDNLLAHAIFGHELGHPIADQFLTWDEAETPGKLAQSTAHAEVLAFVKELVKQNPSLATKELELVTGVFDRVLEIRKRAVEELVSDAVGIFVFGPSALFAMHELFWYGDWDSPPSSPSWYPPSRMRLRLMMQMLDDKGKALDALIACSVEPAPKYLKEVAAFVEHNRAITAQQSDEATIQANREISIAYNWVKTSLPSALNFAEGKLAGVIYDTHLAIKHLPEMLQRLELGVPPNEVGEPLKPETVDARSPLLAAWVYKTHGIDAQSGESLTLKEVDKLNLQTLLAVEYVLLSNAYTEHLKKAGINQ